MNLSPDDRKALLGYLELWRTGFDKKAERGLSYWRIAAIASVLGAGGIFLHGIAEVIRSLQ